MLLSCLLGLLIGIGRLNPQRRIAYSFSSIYLSCFRGTPLLVQLFIWFYGLPRFGLLLPAFVCGMLGLGMYSASYVSEVVRGAIRPGMTTLELDRIAEESIRAAGAHPNFQLVPGYSHTVCVSVNDEDVHGIPGERVIQPGDIVSIDCGAETDEGWNGDSAISIVVPDPDDAERVALHEELSRITGCGFASM